MFGQIAWVLERLDRYERRAMSRRNAALVEIERLKTEPNPSLMDARLSGSARLLSKRGMIGEAGSGP